MDNGWAKRNTTAPKVYDEELPFCYDFSYDGGFWSNQVISIEEFSHIKESLCFQCKMLKSLESPEDGLRHVGVTNERELLVSKEELNEMKEFKGKHTSLLLLRHSTLKFYSRKSAYYVELSRGFSKLILYNTDWKQINSFYGLLLRLCPKEVFSHSYEILDHLGSGAYSDVFKAQRKSDKSLVAAKFLDKQKLKLKPKIQQSLCNEIMIMAALNHPNIPKLLDIVSGEAEMVIVMEFIPGTLLFYLIKERRLKGIDDKILVLQGLISCVKYLQENRVFHRDIKPENIVLRNDDPHQPVLIDFGFAVREENSNDSIRCGTPGYIPPEIFEKLLGFTHKSDVYSIGITFYMILTSCFPFSGKTNSEVLEKNKKAEINYKRHIWDHIPPDGNKLNSLHSRSLIVLLFGFGHKSQNHHKGNAREMAQAPGQLRLVQPGLAQVQPQNVSGLCRIANVPLILATSRGNYK